MKITVLSENTALSCDLGAEHSLSLYIEDSHRKILFDAGQSPLFAENAARLGIDLSLVDMMILSHGHYDHGGGIARFLELNEKAPVYVSKYAFGEFWDSAGKYIGIDPALRESPRIVLTDSDLDLGGGISLCHGADMSVGDPCATSDLLECVDGEKRPDRFLHEQYLLMEEGRVLFSGCSHRGIGNIVSCFRPRTFVGGFHLSSRPLGGELRELAEYLGSLDTDYYTCHCTGVQQCDFMKEYMPRLSYISGGMSITV